MSSNESFIFMGNDKIAYIEEYIVLYFPKRIRTCQMVKKNKDGEHSPFVVVDYYDIKEMPVFSMPYFEKGIVDMILNRTQTSNSFPKEFYAPQYLQYISVHLNRPAYRLYNHTDVLKGLCTIEDIYKPVVNKEGEFIMKDNVIFLIKCVKDNETGAFYKNENVQESFNNYFQYCYEYERGAKRKLYEEMLKDY